MDDSEKTVQQTSQTGEVNEMQQEGQQTTENQAAEYQTSEKEFSEQQFPERFKEMLKELSSGGFSKEKTRKLKKMEKKVRHGLLNHPVISMILIVILGILLANLLSIFSIILPIFVSKAVLKFAGSCESILVALIMLLIHRHWFRNQYDGSFHLHLLGFGLLMLTPTLIIIAGNLIGLTESSVNPLAALLQGLAPGLYEEVLIRGVVIPNYMRVWTNKKGILLSVTLTSLLFGLIHLINITLGADMLQTSAQVVYAFGLGVMFAATFIRTGNLWPSVIMHTLIDAAAFLSPELYESGGILAKEVSLTDIIPGVVMGLAFAAVGYFYIRSSKHEEIIKLWSGKWSVYYRQTEALDRAKAAGEAVREAARETVHEAASETV